MRSALWCLIVAWPSLVWAQAFPGPVEVSQSAPPWAVMFLAPQRVICDSGCSGSAGLTDAELRAAPVPMMGTVTFDNASLAVTNAGTFAVQAAQSGTWNVGTVTSITNPVAVQGTVTVQDGGGVLTVDGTVACSNCGGAVGVPFQCSITTTATASATVAGCLAPGANLTRYLTDVSWASSIISTTTNFMTLQYGTGTNCGTGTTVVYRMFQAPAFAAVHATFQQPIKLGPNTDLCVLHPGTGTRVLNVQGYVAAP